MQKVKKKQKTPKQRFKLTSVRRTFTSLSLLNGRAAAKDLGVRACAVRNFGRDAQGKSMDTGAAGTRLQTPWDIYHRDGHLDRRFAAALERRTENTRKEEEDRKKRHHLSVGKNKGLMLDKTTRFSRNGKQIYNFMSCSTFTEYTCVDEFACVKIDPRAKLDEVCLIACGFSTGYGTVINIAKVKPGTTCVVFGLGGIGMSAVMGCKVSGAARIIGVDINSTKFPRAKELGCTECINPNDCDKPIHEVIVAMTDGGADYGFECIGKVDVMASMIQSTQYSYGSANIIGVPKYTDRLVIDVMWLLTGRTVKGGFLGDCKAPLDFPGFVTDAINKKVDLSKLVTHKLPFEKINEGFDLMRNGKCVRTVLIMHKCEK